MKDDDDFGLGSLLMDQQMDQAETGLEAIAKMMAIFYKTLRREGVPEGLATELVRQQHLAIVGMIVRK